MKFARVYRSHFYFASIAAILLSLVSALRPWLLQQTIDKYISTKDSEGLLIFIILMLIALIVEVLLQLLFIYISNWLGQHIIRDIREQLFKHMMHFKMEYFDKSSVGRLVTRVVSDSETIASFFGQGLFMIVSDLLKMIVVAIVMLWMNWKLSLITFAVLPLLVYATKIFQIAIKSAYQEVRIQVANLNGFVQERIIGMNIVQLFGREEAEYQKFVSINSAHKKAHIKTVWYYSVFFPIAEVLSSVAIGLLVWYGGLRAVVDSSITVGQIIGFITMAEMLYRPLRQIADKFNTLQMGLVAATRVFEVLDTESKLRKIGTIKASNLKGNISFKNVHFSYVKGEEVLKGLSFDVKQGERIAIVGATGSGKSTIISLINRFYEIEKGEICLDNQNIEDFTIESLRDEIAVVLQDVFLFSDDIYNNITLKNPTISLETVMDAAKQIGIHDFIMSLPGGYGYNVKERGAMLSSGQRQLIAFLRAYVSNPTILILDEATSSIDSHSEKLIQFATDKITQNRTSIIIAHRLATVKKVDKIIVMDKGEIKEIGNHKELLKIENGFYKNLYHKQFAVLV
ncbi:MAG TPA: ABC transporter ATP-binding protein [Flavobacteriaceae bacterium]|nr:ABC transporter ATP-binding protein [Flavobacteriaceae bacterium]